MPKAIVTMLLALISSGAAAEWIEVYETDTVTFHVDPTTIRKSGNMAKMWGVLEYKTPEKTFNNKLFKSQRTQFEFDCKEEQWRTLFSTFFEKSMVSGDSVNIDSTPGPWTPVPPNTAAESLWKIGCNKK